MITRKAGMTLVAAALAALAIAPAGATAKGRDGFHATVLSVARDGDSVRVSRSSGRTLRVAITPRTRFERLGGVADLKRGLAIEVKANRTADGWVAREIEISGGDDDRGGSGRGDEPGDDHGGHGNEPGDDHGGHGDEPGDDHGSGGHSSDDR